MPAPDGNAVVCSCPACHRDVMGTFDEVDTTLRAWVDERDFSGSALVTRSGTTVFEGHYGLADQANRLPVTPRTRFALASVTKLFTAVTVVDLVGAGRLDYDDAVVDLLPAHSRPSTLRPDVTVHHLLTHTSGIADYCEEDEEHPRHVADYGDLWDERPCYRMTRPADFLPLFGDLPPDRPPGEGCAYCNAGYVVLGLVVEEVTGHPYTEVVQDRVFTRTGMRESGFFRIDEPQADVAVGYLPRTSRYDPFRTNVFRVPVVGGADGGAHSTAHDLDRFLRALGDGSLLGDQQDVVLTRHAALGSRGHAFGYGPLLFPDGRYGHNGGDPGVEAVVRRLPWDDVHLVVLANGEGVADDVYDLLNDAWQAT